MANPFKPLSPKLIKRHIEELEYGKRVLSDALNAAKAELALAKADVAANKANVDKQKADKEKFKADKDVTEFNAYNATQFAALTVAEQRAALFKVLKVLIKEL